MLQRWATAAICRSLRTDTSATSRWLTCREFGRGKSRLSTDAAGVAMADFKERLRPLGPGMVELCLDDDSGVATLVLDNPDRCNGESKRGSALLASSNVTAVRPRSTRTIVCVVRVFLAQGAVHANGNIHRCRVRWMVTPVYIYFDRKLLVVPSHIFTPLPPRYACTFIYRRT